MSTLVHIGSEDVGSSLGEYVGDAARIHPVDMYLNQLRSKLSRQQQLSRLRRFSLVLSNGLESDPRNIPWVKVNGQVWVNVRNHMLDELLLSHATINGTLAAVKGVVLHGYINGVFDFAQKESITLCKSLSVSDDKQRRPKRTTIKPAVLSRFFDGLRKDRSSWGVRDLAMFALLANTASRRAEIASIMIDDLDLHERCVQVKGKGSRWRTVGFNSTVSQYIGEWVKTIRGYEAGPLFMPISKSENLLYERMLTPAAINFILKRRLSDADLPEDSIAPHDFRRTYASNYLSDGGDLSMLRKILGHSNVATTMIYDRRDESEKLDIMKNAKL